jgi:nucleoside-triphosphatase
LTGEPGCGKTTVIRRFYDALLERGIKGGGMISSEIRRGGVRVGFSLEDLLTHESGILAHMDLKAGPRVGKYWVNLSDLQTIGVTAIRKATIEADVVIVDELGPMELNSTPFVEAVEISLASQKHFVGTIHKRASHRLVTSIRSNPTSQIIEVRIENRQQMPSKILEQLTRYGRFES